MKNENKKTEYFLSSLLGAHTKEKTAGISFSLATLLPTLLAVVLLVVGGAFGLFQEGYEEKEWFLYCNFLLPQIAYAIVVFLFFAVGKNSVSKTIGKASWKYFLLALILQFGLFSLGELNGWFLTFLENFGYENKPLQIPSLDGAGLYLTIFTIALLPAIFEETLFRGIIMEGVKPFGTVGAVLLCGGLFSLFHQNPAQTIYQFCCGVAYALVALRSGSVLPTMLAHFLNNAVIILLTKFSVAISPIIIAFSGVCLLVTITYLIFFDKKEIVKGEKARGLSFLLCASVGILICVISWCLNLFGGV